MSEKQKSDIKITFQPGKRIQQIKGKTRHISFRSMPVKNPGLIKSPK